MVTKNKTTKKTYSKKYVAMRHLENLIEKRYNILAIIILIFMLILLSSLFYVQVIKKNYYQTKLDDSNSSAVYGDSAPRGRIYDRKGRVIVDNKAVKVIYYTKKNGVSSTDEIDLAYKVADMIDVDYSTLHSTNIKEFWLANNKDEANNRVTDDEYKQLKERKITNEEIDAIKLARVTDEDIKNYTSRDKEAAYIYYLMNKGYATDEKNIKTDATDKEYALIAENIDELEGFNVKLSWERYYPYGNTFRTILGNVSDNGIPAELKDYYLNLGYDLNDRVGTSYIEYQYDSVLKGTKNKYQVDNNGDLELVEEGKRGNDIVLSIDIVLQQEVEKILEAEVKYSIQNENMIYYNRSFAIIQEPSTGEILAMAGVQVLKDGDTYKDYDYSAGIVTQPVTVGSAVKGASHIVGYNTGALQIGEVRKDGCIKIASTPIKCSWTTLGTLDDIGALKESSNVYQFYTAINVGKGHYVENQPLTIDETAFDTYRNTFAQFGLGVSTGIDLPVESLGYKGTSRLPGHLLDFAIGQYDTYTPLQLSQYITTIANNGNRVQTHLLKAVYKPTKTPLTELVYEYQPVVLNKVVTEQKYMDRVHEGFHEVLSATGTGANYVDRAYDPAGKTGTSESFIDTDNDGVVDTDTLSNTFVAYAPYNNPKVTFTVVSPDIGYYKNGNTVRSYVNRRISYEVSKKYFEIYQ